MLTRTPPMRQVALVLVFVVAAFGLLLYVWQRFGGAAPLQPQGYRVHVHFEQAQNLQANADVRMAGVKIGRVVSVTPTTKRTDAVLELEPKYVPLRQGTRVITRIKTLLGETFIAIAPGSRDAPAIPDGGAIPDRDVAPTQQLDEVLGAFDAKTRTTLRRYLEQTAAAVHGRGEALNQTLGNLGPTAEDLDRLISTLDAQRPALSAFVSQTGVVFDALARRPDSLRRLVRSGDAVLATTDRVRDGLRGTIDALVPLQKELRASTRSGLAAARLARPTLHVLRPATRSTGAAIAGARDLGHELAALFRALPPALDASKRGLPASQRMLEAARPLDAELQQAGRNLVPVLDLARVYASDIVGGIASLAAAAQVTAPGTDGVARHYLRSLVVLSNESSAKQPARYYTNRHNAYPRPGWLDDLASGRLTSSDCDGLALSPTAPTVPLGTQGVSPCLVQGGWDFRGATRYYPLMQPLP